MDKTPSRNGQYPSTDQPNASTDGPYPRTNGPTPSTQGPNASTDGNPLAIAGRSCAHHLPSERPADWLATGGALVTPYVGGGALVSW